VHRPRATLSPPSGGIWSTRATSTSFATLDSTEGYGGAYLAWPGVRRLKG
jgi:hypothetical protein